MTYGTNLQTEGGGGQQPRLYLPGKGSIQDPAVATVVQQLLQWANSLNFGTTAQPQVVSVDATIGLNGAFWYLLTSTMTTVTLDTSTGPGILILYNATSSNVTLTPSAGKIDNTTDLVLATFTGATIGTDGANWYTLGKG
jgi:hypothetical protein